MTHSTAIAPAGRLFSIAAMIQAATWAGLLVGMLLKYGTGATDLGVRLFGRLHGAAFLVCVAMAFIAGARLRWPMWALLLAVFAAVPPLATLPLERWYRRRGPLPASEAIRDFIPHRHSFSCRSGFSRDHCHSIRDSVRA